MKKILSLILLIGGLTSCDWAEAQSQSAWQVSHPANGSVQGVVTMVPNGSNIPQAVTSSNPLPVTVANAVPVTQSGESYVITQTAVAITGTSGQLIAANSTRKYLGWMVIGTADVTCTPGSSAAVVGVGYVYQSAGANKQGSSQEFPHGAPTSAFQCIAAGAGSTVYVWEGN